MTEKRRIITETKHRFQPRPHQEATTERWYSDDFIGLVLSNDSDHSDHVSKEIMSVPWVLPVPPGATYSVDTFNWAPGLAGETEVHLRFYFILKIEAEEKTTTKRSCI